MAARRRLGRQCFAGMLVEASSRGWKRSSDAWLCEGLLNLPGDYRLDLFGGCRELCAASNHGGKEFECILLWPQRAGHRLLARRRFNAPLPPTRAFASWRIYPNQIDAFYATVASSVRVIVDELWTAGQVWAKTSRRITRG